jgi:hypothetical protein
MSMAAIVAACGAPRRVQQPVASAARAVRCGEGLDASSDAPAVGVDVAAESQVFVPDASPALTHPIGDWPCTSFDRRNAAVLALMYRVGAAFHPHPTRVELAGQYAFEARYSAFARCFPTPGGAWGVVLDPERPSQWWLRHRDGQGHEVGLIEGAILGTDREGAFLEQGTDYDPPYDHAADMRLFDFDGDGEPEIAFTYETRREHAGEDVLRIYRYARGRIAELPTPLASRLEDVDEDGRPDAVTVHSNWSTTRTLPEDTHCGAQVEGPSTAARSLPGGAFSRSDPAVRAFNRRA